MRRGMLGQNTLAAGLGDALDLPVGIVQHPERLLGAVGDQNLLARAHEAVQSFPRVTQQRGAASGRLEQPAGGAIPHGGHVRAGHIERQPRRAKKPGMPARGHVTQEPQVPGPRKIIRIPRSAQHETLVRAAARRLDQQSLQLVLPVGGIGSQVGKIRTRLRRRNERAVRFGIDMSVQGHHAARSQHHAKGRQRGPAGVAQDQVEVAQSRRRHILDRLSRPDARQRNRSIQVIKHAQRPGRRVADQLGRIARIRTVGTDDHRVGIPEVLARDRAHGAPVVIEHQARTRQRCEITVGRVVGHVLLEERHRVSARAQRADQSAPQGSMTVTPG